MYVPYIMYIIIQIIQTDKNLKKKSFGIKHAPTTTDIVKRQFKRRVIVYISICTLILHSMIYSVNTEAK